MKLIELLKNVDRSNNQIPYNCTEEICRIFHLDHWLLEDELDKLKFYWIKSWICTDTQVGLAAIYLEDELVASFWQPARKSDEEIRFVSNDAAKKVKKYIETMLKDGNYPIHTVKSLEEEIDLSCL